MAKRTHIWWIAAVVLIWLVPALGYLALRWHSDRERGIAAAGDGRKVALNRDQWYNRKEVLDLREGRIVPLADAAARHAPWVALVNTHFGRNSGSLFGPPDALPELAAGFVDIRFAPADGSGKPQRNYWADESADHWPEGPWRKSLFYQWKVDVDHAELPMLWRSVDGTVGVMRVVGSDFRETVIQTKVIARRDAAGGMPVNPTGVTFLDGTYFEILAISADVTDPNAWFAPGRGTLPLPPATHSQQMEHYREWGNDKYTAVGLVRLEAYGQSPHGHAGTWGFEGVSVHGSGSTLTMDEFGNHLPFLNLEVLKIAGQPDCVDYRMGVASGPWRTALRTEKEPARTEVDGRIVEFEAPVDTDETFGVPVTYSPSWHEVSWRVVVEEYPSAQPQPIRSSVARPTTQYLHGDHFERVERDGQDLQRAVFKPMGPPQNMPYLGDVKEFRFEWRPYDRVRIRNVPLRPEVECEIVIEKEWATDAPGSRKQAGGSGESADE